LFAFQPLTGSVLIVSLTTQKRELSPKSIFSLLFFLIKKEKALSTVGLFVSLLFVMFCEVIHRLITGKWRLVMPQQWFFVLLWLVSCFL
jgi:hypothetical protein